MAASTDEVVSVDQVDPPQNNRTRIGKSSSATARGRIEQARQDVEGCRETPERQSRETRRGKSDR